jgi:hypothetical protein
MTRVTVISTLFTAWTLAAGTVFAQEELQQPQLVAPATYDDSYTRPTAETSPSDQPAPYVPTAASDLCSAQGSCCNEPACGCEESSCCCESGCCDGCCDCGGGSLLGDCCLGDAWTLHEELSPCCDHTYGGWVSIGYHSDNTRLSEDFNDLRAFNDQPDHLNLQQAWVYFEKVADADCCSSDWGYRYDIVYGTDAQKIQSFGNDGGRWDVTFDNGSYGWAMPQAYLEFAQGDWSVKAGRFFTVFGYETASAPHSFFYSHALTFYNSQAFGHTGVLSSYQAADGLKFYAGWTLGWDTGFDQLGGGSNWLGGFAADLNDDVTFRYISAAGDFGYRGEGYAHSLVFDVAVSECLNYVLYSGYVNADDSPNGVGFDGVEDNEEVSIVQYLVYTLNDCWAAGGRMEWWKSNSVTGESTSFYELTGGINYRAHANLTIRPEIRYDWTPAEEAVDDDYNNVVFGIDAVLTF